MVVLWASEAAVVSCMAQAARLSLEQGCAVAVRLDAWMLVVFLVVSTGIFFDITDSEDDGMF